MVEEGDGGSGVGHCERWRKEAEVLGSVTVSGGGRRRRFWGGSL